MDDVKGKDTDRSCEQNLDKSLIELEKANRNLKKTLNSVIEAISTIAEIHDPSMLGHQRRVAALSVAIGRKMKLPQEKIDGLKTASLVHDIGKISIPSNIISQPELFSHTARALMRVHPTAGYKILKKIPFPQPVSLIVYQHHERCDGSGYPLGMKGGDVLIESKILSVADVLEAMTSKRPHREKLGLHAAQEELSKNKGRAYDATVVDACLELIKAMGYNLNFID